MSVSSVRLQNVSAFTVAKAVRVALKLTDVNLAYFIVPLAREMYFYSKSGHEIRISPGEMLVGTGGPNATLVSNPQGSDSTESSVPGLEIAHLRASSFSADNNESASIGALIVSVDLCEPFKNGLRKVLPAYLHLENLPSESSQHITQTALQIIRINRKSDPYSRAACDRLTELLFIQSIDHYFSNGNSQSGILKAMSDKRLRGALGAIHDQPGYSWTVDKLARISSMSRSLFAERFKLTVNETPLGYVKLCRIEQAKLMLRESNASIDQVAQEAGYASISSFVKAFSSTTGVTPGKWRDGSAKEKVT